MLHLAGETLVFFAECLSRGADFWGDLDACMKALFKPEMKISSDKKDVGQGVKLFELIESRRQFLDGLKGFFVASKDKVDPKVALNFELKLLIQTCENYQKYKILANGFKGRREASYIRVGTAKDALIEMSQSSEGLSDSGLLGIRQGLLGIFGKSGSEFKKICQEDVKFVDFFMKKSVGSWEFETAGDFKVGGYSLLALASSPEQKQKWLNQALWALSRALSSYSEIWDCRFLKQKIEKYRETPVSKIAFDLYALSLQRGRISGYSEKLNPLILFSHTRI